MHKILSKNYHFENREIVSKVTIGYKKSPKLKLGTSHFQMYNL